MQCPRCGTANRVANLYCEACAAPLGPACGVCGHVNHPGSRYCGQCSAPLAAADRVSTGDPLQPLKRSDGERKRLTVLFADIRNSTELIERADPEDARRRMRPALAAMKEAVNRYDGVVNKMQGDGIMALFGAPVPHEDHAVRACLAALAMQDAVARLGDPDIGIRVGLHTGEVVVQATANDLSHHYDAIGVTVHLASRMEQMSGEAGILLTAATVAAARHFIEVRALGARSVRGISEPVEVFALTGLKHAPASELFRSGPRLNALAGRDDALAALERELAYTRRGEARVVGVVGEAGIGKSRLCYEFAERCRQRGIRVFETRVLSHGKATPLQPVLELLRNFFGIRQGDAAELSQRKLAARLQAMGLGESLPLLMDFLGVADPARPAPRLDPKTRKLKLLDLVRRVARSGRSDVVTVVLVEDVHWIDAASEEFVEALVDAVVGTTTFVLLNFRSGHAAPWMQRSHYRQISLAPLGAADANRLLAEMLGEHGSLALLRRHIAERAQGNPFFLEELVRSLIERGDFEGERGAYRLTRGIEAIPLPTTVQAVIGARIDRLDETTKRILQSAAVVGREVPTAVIERVSGLTAADVAEALWRLRRAELLYEVPPFEQGLHAFRHPLIQEVAYRSLLQEARRKLHAAVAQAIEALYRERPQERAALLAYHWEEAGERLTAAQHSMRAAMWIGATDSGQALRNWHKVRELLEGLPPTQGTNYLRMVASGQIVNFGWREGISAEEAKVYFDEAQGLARAAGDARASALILAAYGRIIAASGSADEYVGKVLEAERLAEGTKDASLQVTLKAVLCNAYRLAGRMRDALAVNVAAMARAHEIGDFDRQMLGFDIETWLTGMRGQTLVMMGRGEEARPYLDRLLQLDPNRTDVTHQVLPSAAYVDLAWLRGDAALAAEHADRAFTLAETSGNPYLRVFALAYRGLAHGIAGRLDEAIDDLTSALAFARWRKAGLENDARILADLGDVLLRRGNAGAALRAADEAIEIARTRHARLPECRARIVRASALLAAEGPAGSAAAAAELARAGELVEETGAAAYRAFVDAARAKLPAAAGALAFPPSRTA
jgi:class 3 adenylate cyclase/tetratricopeptide (TPR) repeat protein